MPTVQGGVTTNPKATSGGRGKSNTELLRAVFPQNPVGLGTLEDNGEVDSPLRQHFQELCMDGVVPENAGEGPAQGWMAPNEFNRDFVDAPDYNDVPTGGGGLPASPWVPNPVSPGEGSMNASDLPEPPDGFGQVAKEQWPVATNTNAVSRSPKARAEAISSFKLGTYLKDRSSTLSQGH